MLKRGNINNFLIKKININKHLIFTENLTDFKKTQDILKQNNIKFFTYTSKIEKKITILLKNIEGDFDPKEILEELTNKNIEGLKFVNVKKFETKKSKLENRKLPIFIVQLTPESIISNLKKIKTHLHSIVIWEKIHKVDRLQCKRCQRIGHAAINCNLDYRCVKCDTNHNPGECSLSLGTSNKDETIQPYCINCKSFGHPASYRGYPKLKEIKEKIAEKQKAFALEREKKIVSINNYISKGKSFSSVVAGERENTLLTNKTQNVKQLGETANVSKIDKIDNRDALKELKNSLLTAMEKQFEKIVKEINKNSEKINFLASVLDLDIEEIQ